MSTDRLSSRLPCVPVPEGGGPAGPASGVSANVSERELAALAHALAACAARGDVIALSGPLGAGKTTFARHFIRSYAQRRGGAAEEVPSPTFTLVQLYGFGDDAVWHIDLYRIGAPEELWEIGFEEALAGGICLIEWPERAGPLLPDRRIDIALEHTGDPARRRISVDDRTGEDGGAGGDGAAGRLKPLFDRLAGIAAAAEAAAAEAESRAQARSGFLAGTDWRDAPMTALSGDASFRRYFRLAGGPSPALLMDAPPAHEDAAAFVRVARHLCDLGFSAPAIHAEDPAQGFLVIEDFGDATFTRLLAEGADEAALYRLAADTLIALHRHPAAASVEAPPYDGDALQREADLLIDWFLPAVIGAPTPPAAAAEYRAVWRSLYPLAETAPPTLVLRDYHVDNLMELPGRAGVAACGLLDFQDAVIGSPAYDLVSLVADARRDIRPALRDATVERYLAAFPALDRADFLAAAAMLSAQRNCKIIGIFTRLMARDGKPVYLQHIPRVWRLLEADLAHPALAPVRAWLDAAIPPALRIAPRFGDRP
ncbi:MAG: tRNA (adenosine(37)-N6)-threonylcarbamoyltransferase complex ATPase subunit type 1 TsaE [Rhodospirillaceae bacterium]|nr:tRNA (adenosine(37)-N6)-threonylcarbamoyltransferase complex ATPase subunit type 1 TsaE [Rhodospirillaceae bacterium]MCY4066380.1 tRNA (adenosine(37)-N6)-threonylcarbamoyltransferase complex ATPase subunit type 1 TsaE [Rhodospirillaceae bacterium]